MGNDPLCGPLFGMFTCCMCVRDSTVYYVCQICQLHCVDLKIYIILMRIHRSVDAKRLLYPPLNSLLMLTSLFFW